jgi:hypothetical protein
LPVASDGGAIATSPEATTTAQHFKEALTAMRLYNAINPIQSAIKRVSNISPSSSDRR